MKVSQEEREKKYELIKKIYQHDLKKAYPNEDLPSIEGICFPYWNIASWKVNDYMWWNLIFQECNGIRYAHIYRVISFSPLEEYERMYVIDKNYSIIGVISPEKYYRKPMQPLEFWKRY